MSTPPTVGSPAPAALDLRWRWCRFDALELRELQYIFAARQRVFGLEQQCVYLDIDGCDERAFHLAAWSGGHAEPLAYARILDPGVKYVEASIGRVVTSGAGRGWGLGRELMARAIGGAAEAWPGVAIRISAQTRLERFYASFGFAATGPPYLEDGIDHTEMLLVGGVRNDAEQVLTGR
ncbi:MAG: GNAT family N-acetyltransferase [Pseudomonadota bacterium]|nr:GNAT family N-acetyltransferase [Pseudomonadota bacterium]